MIFSERYERSLRNGTLIVELNEEARTRIWAWMIAHNRALHVKRNENTNSLSSSSTIEESVLDFALEVGIEIDEIAAVYRYNYVSVAKSWFNNHEPPIALSLAELYWSNSEPDNRVAFSKRTNEIMRSYDCPWRIADGQFFKLSSDFVVAESIEASHEAMINAGFQTPAGEFARGRDALAIGDIRETINNAGHSYESVMKSLLDIRKGNAKALLDKLRDAGYLNDVHADDRNAFIEKVMLGLTFMRNTFAGHGYGKEAINLPPAYGELALALAGALNSFLISLHLERKSSKPPETAPDDSKVPF